MSELKIVSPNEALKEAFASWLCNSGEQDFIKGCKMHLNESVHLAYHGKEDEEFARNDVRRYGKFLCDNTIRVTVVDEDED